MQFAQDEPLPVTSLSNLFPPLQETGKFGDMPCLEEEEEEETEEEEEEAANEYGWQYRVDGTMYYVPRGRVEDINTTFTAEDHPNDAVASRMLERCTSALSGLDLGLPFQSYPHPPGITPPGRPKKNPTSLPPSTVPATPLPPFDRQARGVGRPTSGASTMDDIELVSRNLALLDLATDDVDALSQSLTSLTSSPSNEEPPEPFCQTIKEAMVALADALSNRWTSIHQSGAWDFRSASWQRKHVGRMMSLETTLRRLIAIRDNPTPLNKKLTVLHRKLAEHESKLQNLVHNIHASFDRLELKFAHWMLVQAHVEAKQLKQLHEMQLQSQFQKRGDEEYIRRWQEEKTRREELKRKLWGWKTSSSRRC